MGIKHEDVKATGQKGYASEWNKDHVIDADVDFDGNTAVNLKAPSADDDAATKVYVDAVKIADFYDGADYDVTRASAGISTDTHEFAAIDAADLTNVNYIRITIQHQASLHIEANVDGYAEVGLKAEMKEVGGAYAEIKHNNDEYYLKINGAHAQFEETSIRPWIVIGPVTAGMKTNGAQIQVTSRVENEKAGSSATFANNYTIIEFCK